MSYGNYEMPDGSWDMEREDADYQQAELERLGNRAARLEARGFCTHGAGQPLDGEAFKAGKDLRFCCAGCGGVFDTADMMFTEGSRIIEEG